MVRVVSEDTTSVPKEITGSVIVAKTDIAVER
jgi:hypothetical protein